MTTASSQRLRRSDRLRERRDFQRAAREGIRVNAHSFILIAATRWDPGGIGSRLGITASRRVGNSVRRSLVKRRVREWFRRHQTDIPTGLDLVVIARATAGSLDQLAADRELQDAARRIGQQVAPTAGVQ